METTEVRDVDDESEQEVCTDISLTALFGTREPIDLKKENEFRRFDQMMREVPGV